MRTRGLSMTFPFPAGVSSPIRTKHGMARGSLEAAKTNGPRCIRASRGPASSFQRRISGTSQYDLGIRHALGLCAPVPLICANCRRLIEASSCLLPQLRPDLALSKVPGLIRRRHAPLQELANGLASASCVASRSYDWTSLPAKWGAERSVIRQVQHTKCCGR